MASELGGTSDAFDIRTIRQLVKLMNENDLAEIDLRNATERLRLRKRGGDMAPEVTTVPIAAAGPIASTADKGPESRVGNSLVGPVAANFVDIKSPMLGTFYRATAPDADPFVQVGSHVDNETVVCIIEAMKVFNEIAAENRGKVVAILVENGQPVEFGQPLFRLDPAG